MNVTIKEIAKTVQAINEEECQSEETITGVEFDSRKIEQGNLFVPLKGARDGHSFLPAAIENGAKVSLWQKDVAVPPDFPVILVEDVLLAFQKLARYYLQKIQPTVIAVTGSNGKTTTKDMIEAVLSRKFSTYKTQGNYNNEIGLPYTILHMPEKTEKLVLEMGMDHPGDIHLLSEIATPDLAVITLVGESHLEFFGSRENIARGKMEIVDGLKEGGLLLVPQDELLISPLLQNVQQKVCTFGWGNSAELGVKVVKEEKNQTTFQVNFLKRACTIPVSGKYNAKNAMIAAFIGKLAHISEEEIAKALSNVSLTKNRTQWKKAGNGAEILSDVYNANPTAMGLVLSSFSKMPVHGKGRRIAVLGDMLELGEQSRQLHQEMKQYLKATEIAHLFLYGKEMASLLQVVNETYPEGNVHYYKQEDKQKMTADILKFLQPEDLILFKASNGMGLADVVEKIE